MSQVGGRSAKSTCSANGVADQAGGRKKDLLALLLFCREILLRGIELMIEPILKIGRGLRNDEKTHVRVLQAAKLRTLPAICSDLIRLEHKFVEVIRNGIDLGR